ncbi:MAG TPA: helix-turn-helix domain-containing protein [Candidatus Tetragenococcus pullicola]|nr:helix-turn-helix domain-containing protein [Candidatus Tetragenococcus pullicola]
MNSGELIRELRKERKITQAQLAEGIVHRTTLNSFENENSTTSCEVLFQYLDKLNISLEEFEFLYRDRVIDEKQSLSKKVTESFHLKFDRQLASSILKYYEETKDFFYYALYAEYVLNKSRTDASVLKSDEVDVIKQTIKGYLESITTWGRFELTLFTNCLFMFDDELIRFEFRESVQHMHMYLESSNYSKDLINFLKNGLNISYKRHCTENVALFLSELKKVADNYSNSEAYLYVRIFDFLIRHDKGENTEKEKYEILFVLKSLNENGWIRYINKYYQEK